MSRELKSFADYEDADNLVRNYTQTDYATAKAVDLGAVDTATAIAVGRDHMCDQNRQ